MWVNEYIKKGCVLYSESVLDPSASCYNYIYCRFAYLYLIKTSEILLFSHNAILYLHKCQLYCDIFKLFCFKCQTSGVVFGFESKSLCLNESRIKLSDFVPYGIITV